MPAIPALESGGRLEFKTSSLARPYLKTPMKRNRYMTNVYFISNAATSQYKEIKFFCLVNMLLVCLLVSSLIFLLWITNLKKKKKVRRCHFFFQSKLKQIQPLLSQKPTKPAICKQGWGRVHSWTGINVCVSYLPYKTTTLKSTNTKKFQKSKK